jgi:hypothetical protein
MLLEFENILEGKIKANSKKFEEEKNQLLKTYYHSNLIVF